MTGRVRTQLSIRGIGTCENCAGAYNAEVERGIVYLDDQVVKTVVQGQRFTTDRVCGADKDHITFTDVGALA